jgi:hypothetical protein
MEKNMHTRILLSVVMITVVTPLQGVLVTFQRGDHREYTILKCCNQIITDAPVKTAISRQSLHIVNDEKPSLMLAVDPRDVIHILTYIQQSDSTVRSVIKQFSPVCDSVVLITEHGGEIISEQFAKM